MNIALDADDLATLLESLKYSRQRVQDSQGTPYEVRRQNMDRLDSVAAKLRQARTQEQERLSDGSTVFEKMKP